MRKLFLSALLSAGAFYAGQLLAGPPDTCYACQWACNSDECRLLGCIQTRCN